MPSNFNDAQKKSTEEAGKIAGLNVLRLISEPTSSCLTYGFNKNFAEKIILVFDLGGGTLDVTILEAYEEKFNVIATKGDSNLGGEDFDNRMVDFCINKFKEENEIETLKLNSKSIRRLKKECEIAKINLSSATSAIIEVDNL